MTLLALSLFGCDTEAEGKRSLDVFAASSLQEALEGWEADFERAHPDVDVRLTFAGSQILRLQIEQGARADVFASADAGHVAALEKRRVLADSSLLARSELVVVVPKEQKSIARFSDLPRAERIVLGTEAVPIGRYSRRVLAAADREMKGFSGKVQRATVSYENNVRLVRAKVEMGEADAAFVYRTEARQNERLSVIPIPERFNVMAEYRIGVLTGTNQELAESFVASLLSPAGQEHLRRFGFRSGGDR